MRIIAGTYRRRVIEAPPGLATRPTSDRLRETLFNVLAPRIRSAAFLDLYAGSGAVGIEALSRGASRVTFVERAEPALACLRGNLARLGLSSRFRVQSVSVGAFLRYRKGAGPKPEPYEVVFLDPPYDSDHEYETTLGLLGGPSAQLLASGAVVVAEHRSKQALADAYGNLKRTRLLKQGDAALSFYAPEPSGQQEVK